jgi:hypothetical protein
MYRRLIVRTPDLPALQAGRDNQHWLNALKIKLNMIGVVFVARGDLNLPIFPLYKRDALTNFG